MRAKQSFLFTPPKKSDFQTEQTKETVSMTNVGEQNGKEEEMTLPFEVKYILRSNIRENKKNRYPKENIDKMKESILHFGLQQNLTAIYVTEEDSYVLEAGHTRLRALDALIEEFASYLPDSTDPRYLLFKKNVLPFQLRGYPCLVKQTIEDGILYDYEDGADLEEIPEEIIDSEIRLILSNEISRNRTPATIAENISRLNELYKRKNKSHCSNKDKINVNETIAEQMDLSVKQVKNYKSIQNLIPELKIEFEKNKITLTESSNYAKLSKEEQQHIVDILHSKQNVTSRELQTLVREKQKLEAEIKKKERELSSLSSTKKDEIIKLQKELKQMKEKTPNLKTPLTEMQIKATKYDISIRRSFENCKKALTQFLEEKERLHTFLSNQEEDAFLTENIITTTELETYLSKLKELLLEKE